MLLTLRAERPLRLPTLALGVALMGACARPAPTTPSPERDAYDVVIENGRIVDGTGNPWMYGDVGIRGDRIATVAPRGALRTAVAAQRIDGALPWRVHHAHAV